MARVADLSDLILLLMGRQVEGKPVDNIAVFMAGFSDLPPFRVRVPARVTPQDYRQEHAASLAKWLPQWFAARPPGQELSDSQQKFVLGVLAGLGKTFTDHCVEHQFNKQNGLSFLRRVASELAESLLDQTISHEPARPIRAVVGGAEAYLRALADYCGALPSWFPRELGFSQIQQEVLVTPPAQESDGGSDVDDSGREAELYSSTPEVTRSRPLPLATALRQYRAVLLLGGPGSGKSWATKGRCLALCSERTGASSGDPLPVLVVAARLEDRLRGGDADSRDLPRLIAECIPDELAVRQGLVDFVADILRAGSNVELLLDGYDEITSARPEVGRQLVSILALLDDSSRFVLTTRPSALPGHQVARLMATLELQPFTEREQLRFIDTWFGQRSRQADSVKRWVRASKLDLLSTPLLIALLCAVTSRHDDVPPDSEPELMHRVLTRLASEEDRFDQQPATDALVQRRIEVLESLAMAYVSGNRLLDAVGSAQLEDSHQADAAWCNLRELTVKANVVDDLVSTGLVQRIEHGRDVGVRFLHSAIRDYLIARALRQTGNWRTYLPRIWSQPEWEPAIAYLAALLPDPDELLLSLERRFDYDPLNSARFVAGRAISLAGDRLGEDRRHRTRGELVILLGSNDPIDRNRSASLLSALPDNETAHMLRSLVNPLAPTRVVEAALRSVAGRVSQASLDVISGCAKDPQFTLGERETAVEALADLASPKALQVLEQMARDCHETASIRAAAAFAALRRMNAPTAARELLATDDGLARDARWGLAERVGAQAQSLDGFLATLGKDAASVPDPYCRAVITTSTVEGTPDFETLASAVPSTPSLDLIVESVEALRAATPTDPLSAVTARFILDKSQVPILRALVASRVGHQPAPAVDFWRALIAELPLEAGIEFAEFFVSESSELPEPYSRLLMSAIEEGRLGNVPREVALRHLSQPWDPPGTTPQASLKNGPPTRTEAALSDFLGAGTRGGLIDYQQLRGLQRDLPPDGTVFAAASSLTHAVAGVGATSWIDALPSVAAMLEQRLALSVHHEAGYELAKLRAAWPRRQQEVESTIESYNASVLSSRALASLLDDNFVDAAAMALASIGAHEANNELPSELVTRILFASGTLARQGTDSYRQVSTYRERFRRNRRSSTLLSAWLHLAAGAHAEVTVTLDGFQPRAFQTQAEVAALRYVAGAGPLESVESVLSWSAARTAQVLVAAVGQFASSPLVRQRIDGASDALGIRARELASGWPDAALHSPSSHGRPPWQRELAAIAAELLADREYRAAVAVFGVALKRRPADPELINNHGFAVMPDDPKVALQELERAASSYSRPFAVNVANRMLLKFRSGDYSGVLEIADTYRRSGTREPNPGTVWLWEIDDPKTLGTFENAHKYIYDLATRSARMLNDFDAVERWAVWAQEMSGPATPETSEEDADG